MPIRNPVPELSRALMRLRRSAVGRLPGPRRLRGHAPASDARPSNGPVPGRRDVRSGQSVDRRVGGRSRTEQDPHARSRSPQASMSASTSSTSASIPPRDRCGSATTPPASPRSPRRCDAGVPRDASTRRPRPASPAWRRIRTRAAPGRAATPSRAAGPASPRPSTWPAWSPPAATPLQGHLPRHARRRQTAQARHRRHRPTPRRDRQCAHPGEHHFPRKQVRLLTSQYSRHMRSIRSPYAENCGISGSLRASHSNRQSSCRATRAHHWSGRLDSNQRPAVPKTAALPGCATPRLPSL